MKISVLVINVPSLKKACIDLSSTYKLHGGSEHYVAPLDKVRY